MKVLFFGKKGSGEQGFSTMEMLIALPLLVVGISAAVMISFGSQSMALDAETNSEGLELAQADGEKARQDAKADFYALVDSSSTVNLDGLDYTVKRKVTDYPCLKSVESRVEWALESRLQYSSLTTMTANLDEAVRNGEDCPTGFPFTPWRHPNTLGTPVEFIPAGQPAYAIDVVKRGDKIYAFVGTIKTPASEIDFWIVDVTDPFNPVFTIADPYGIDTGKGVNSIDVAYFESVDKWYAFLGHNDKQNQLQVVDVTDVTNPQLVKQLTLPCLGGTDAEAQVVKYYNGRVYVGTHYTGAHDPLCSNGPEFHVYSVVNPANPVWLGAKELTHNVNDIEVFGNMAYLATSDNSGEVMMLDVTNPASMVHPDVSGLKFSTSGNADATSIFLAYPKLYVGLKRDNSNDEFYILNVTNPAAVTKLFSVNFDISDLCDVYNPTNGKYTKAKCIAPNTEITGMVVIGTYAFLATSDTNANFQVWNVQDPATSYNISAYNYSEKATDLDYLGNYVYMTNESNAAFRIIFDDVP